MAVSNSERRVFMWRVIPRVKPAAAADRGKTASLDEIVSVLEAAMTGGRARVHVSAGGGLLRTDTDEAPDPKNQIYIADIKRDQKRSIITILFNRGDPNAAPPSFIEMFAGGEVRVENPKPKEAQGWSAHLVISAVGSVQGHASCFEKMPGLSGTLVIAAINDVLERELVSNPEYVYDVVTKTSKINSIVHKRYSPSVEIAQVPSERLIDDLKNGELSSITLTSTTSEYAGPGPSPLIKRQERKLVLHTAKAEPSALEALVKNIVVFAKEHEYQKVTFHLEKLPGGMTNQPTIDTIYEDALAVLYVRAQRLTDFDDLLFTAYANICLQIEGKMVTIIENQEIW